MFNSCTNACNHFQKRYSGSSEVPEEGNYPIIFAPALKIVDKKWIPACLHTPAVSQRALQTLHGVLCPSTFPKRLSRHILMEEQKFRQQAFLLHEQHVLPIYLWFSSQFADTQATHLRGQNEFCHFHSMVKAQPFVLDPGPIVAILTFVTLWLRLQWHTLSWSAGNLS